MKDIFETSLITWPQDEPQNRELAPGHDTHQLGDLRAIVSTRYYGRTATESPSSQLNLGKAATEKFQTRRGRTAPIPSLNSRHFHGTPATTEEDLRINFALLALISIDLNRFQRELLLQGYSVHWTFHSRHFLHSPSQLHVPIGVVGDVIVASARKITAPEPPISIWKRLSTGLTSGLCGRVE